MSFNAIEAYFKITLIQSFLISQNYWEMYYEIMIRL